MKVIIAIIAMALTNETSKTQVEVHDYRRREAKDPYCCSIMFDAKDTGPAAKVVIRKFCADHPDICKRARQ